MRLVWAENWVVVRGFFVGHRALREHHGWEVFTDFGPARFNRVGDSVKRTAITRCLEERVYESVPVPRCVVLCVDSEYSGFG